MKEAEGNPANVVVLAERGQAKPVATSVAVVAPRSAEPEAGKRRRAAHLGQAHLASQALAVTSTIQAARVEVALSTVQAATAEVALSTVQAATAEVALSTTWAGEAAQPH